MRPSSSITRQWAGPAPGWGDTGPLHTGLTPLRTWLKDVTKAEWASSGRAGVPAPCPMEV